MRTKNAIDNQLVLRKLLGCQLIFRIISKTYLNNINHLKLQLIYSYTFYLKN